MTIAMQIRLTDDFSLVLLICGQARRTMPSLLTSSINLLFLLFLSLLFTPSNLGRNGPRALDSARGRRKKWHNFHDGLHTLDHTPSFPPSRGAVVVNCLAAFAAWRTEPQ